jgi:lipoprotein-anchoring transpeptidase ErfK/SrfK
MKKKKKNIIIILIAICIVTVIGIIFFKHSKKIETSTTSEPEEQNYSKEIEEKSYNDIINNSVSNEIKNEVKEVKNEVNENIISNENQNKKNNNENKQNNTSNDKNEVQQSSTKYPTGKTKYYIKVNYRANAVTIYKKDENGYYSIPVKAMVCSCGTATPKSGVYKTSKGYEWGTLEGGTFGRYSTRIIGGILFHSVPYTSESEDSLEYWEYDKLGTTASLGCVRLSVADTKWIFDNCEVGTQVEFYTSSDPGPLGKPTAQKISDNVECRNWDPTDTSSNSPWNK